MEIALTTIEARVIGCLMEKETTTPEYYPLSLKALTAACNQKSNRAPLMALSESEVEEALDELRYKRLAVHVTISGSRVPRYRHQITTLGELNAGEQAVLAELLLRGPQTPGELRTRAGRMHPFASLDEVDAVLSSLQAWIDGAFVRELPLEPGRREARYTQLLCGDIPLPEHAPGEESTDDTRAAPPPASVRIDALEQQVDALATQLAGLTAAFATFREQFE